MRYSLKQKIGVLLFDWLKSLQGVNAEVSASLPHDNQYKYRQNN